MSSFDGKDLFGSGVHNIRMGPAMVAGAEYSFPGVDGTFLAAYGSRGRLGMIRGTLRAASDAALQVLEDAIIDYQVSAAACTLVDGFGRSHGDVVIMEFVAVDRGITTTGVHWMDYEIRLRKLT